MANFFKRILRGKTRNRKGTTEAENNEKPQEMAIPIPKVRSRARYSNATVKRSGTKAAARQLSVISDRSSSTDIEQALQHEEDYRKVRSVALLSANLPDLAEEKHDLDEVKAAQFCQDYKDKNVSQSIRRISATKDPIRIIRSHLPEDPLLNTPFGTRRMTYCDYTASGRSLKFLESYIKRVVMPLYANTHTETSATGLQTTLFRESARSTILSSLHANPEEHDLVFAGSGSTAAIWKLISMLGIHCPKQLLPFLNTSAIKKPLVLVSQAEHHSNELMWRETIADVLIIPLDSTGSLDLDVVRNILEDEKDQRDLIIGSFTAGSNVTGLTIETGPIASLMHSYGGYCCIDYAGAGPYKDMNMSLNTPNDPLSYLDAIYISPHKFVGGPGTPGVLCIRKDFANVRKASELPPTISGGGVVTLVLPIDERPDAERLVKYEGPIHVREEAGTPAIVESIRCGLVFQIRDMVGPKLIEELEGKYAVEAVRRMKAKGIWVMGDEFSGINSPHRLSITSFNMRCMVPNKVTGEMEPLLHPKLGHPLMLHFHFVAALLNDLYGIQARSGCACAGPLAFHIFCKKYPQMREAAQTTASGIYAFRPGFTRVNFNYFIDEDEFDYILSAIEQIAEHGWKLLPLYALCIKSGQYWFNGLVDSGPGEEKASFSRWDAIRKMDELEFEADGSVSWKEPRTSEESRKAYLSDALNVYDNAPQYIRQMLFRFRDLRRKDAAVPPPYEKYRFFALGSEVLDHLGISTDELDEARETALAHSAIASPNIIALPGETFPGKYIPMRPKG